MHQVEPLISLLVGVVVVVVVGHHLRVGHPSVTVVLMFRLRSSTVFLIEGGKIEATPKYVIDRDHQAISSGNKI